MLQFGLSFYLVICIPLLILNIAITTIIDHYHNIVMTSSN